MPSPKPSAAHTGPYPEYILKLNPDVLLGGSFGKLDSTSSKTTPSCVAFGAYQTGVYPITGNLMERPRPPRGGSSCASCKSCSAIPHLCSLC
jgi:hypothetical protein